MIDMRKGLCGECAAEGGVPPIRLGRLTARLRRRFVNFGVGSRRVWWTGQVLCGAGLAVLAGVTAACTSAGGDGGPVRAPSSSAGGVAGAAFEVSELVLTAYRGMWAAYDRAALMADPDYRDLGVFAADGALQTLRAGVESNRRAGLIGQGRVVLDPSVVSMTPAWAPRRAAVRDCVDTSAATRVRATPRGTPFVDARGGRRLVTATVAVVGGSWKVTDFGVREVGSC